MTTEETKLEILKKVENGTLTIDEGSELLGMMERAEEKQTTPQIPEFQPPEESKKKNEVTGCMKALLSMIMVGGAILAAFSAFWVYLGYKNDGLGWGFWLSWIPLLVGVVLMIIGWALMESPWMHLKIHFKEKGTQAGLDFSMPIPFNIARWFFKNFSRFIPEKLRDIDFVEVIDQAEESIKNGEPFEIQIDEEKKGSKVDININ
jgi:hypothetical protein